MKYPIQSMSIPISCHEKWDDMVVNSDGKFCNNCQKNIVDFTKLTDNEVLDILSVGTSKCGRFSPTQLARLNQKLQERNERFSWKALRFAAIFTGLMPVIAVQAQPDLEITQHYTQNTAKKIVNDTTLTRIIRGKITDDGGIIPGASIIVEGTNIGTRSGANGEFSLTVPTEARNLSVRFIGYKEKLVRLQANRDNYDIAVCLEANLMGEVLVVESKKNIWHKIKRFFGYRK